MKPDPAPLSVVERALIKASQAGLPLVARPYDALGAPLGLSGAEVQQVFSDMLARGLIRRIGAVPNHYAIGYVANGMSVWDVADEQVDALGVAVGQLDFVTHCYRRPRRLPLWPYNLFAMVHGHDRQEVERQVAQIATLLGEHCRAHDVLYSSRILKKTGLRLTD